MEEWLGVAAATGGGGLFGLLGTAMGRVASIFERRQALAHERARWAHETRLLELQHQARAAETEAEIVLRDVDGSWRGLEASAGDAASVGESYRWVNAVRALVRPTLTIALWGLYLAVLNAMLQPGAADALGEGDRREILNYFLANAAFAATAATLWWFGDRAPRPKGLGER